jgi:uncharacterized tellurite resistance protein B-like protein
MQTWRAGDGDGSDPAGFGVDLVLDDDLKVSYAAALYHFARIGGVNEVEERTIEAVARSLDIDAGSLRLARHAGLDSARLRALLARLDGAWLVRDALRVAHADGVVGDDERRIIARLAEATGLSARRLALVHEWVEREQALRREWADILDER